MSGSKCAGALALALLAPLLVAPASHAAWPHDPNTNLPITTATSYQDQVDIDSDGNGGAILAWRDLRGGGSDIYVRRVNAAGTPIWTADGVALCTATGDQLVPQIMADTNGGAIVVWIDRRNGAANADLFARRVNAAGNPLWAANGVALCTELGNQHNPCLVSDGAGGAIVAWNDERGATWDIYVRRVTNTGSPQWTANGVALCTEIGNQQYPTIAADGAGGAIVAWEDWRGIADIYAQRVNSAGVPQWPANGVPVCTETGPQRNPQMVSDGAGGAIIVWADSRNGLADIYAQRLNAAGAPLWTPGGVAVSAVIETQANHRAIPDGAGGVIVVWTDDRKGEFDLYAQRMNAAGIAQWTPNGVPFCTVLDFSSIPDLVSDGAGGVIATWADARNLTHDDIYVRAVSANGTPQWTDEGVPLCTAIDHQFEPRIATDGAGGAIVAWYDDRTSTFSDIYAQRIERFGQLGNPEPTIAGVSDVPNDQGGRVQVEWTASYLDAFPGFEVSQYSIWRRVPNAVALATAGHETRFRRTVPILGAQAVYWEYLSSLPARGFPGYSYVAATTSDSMPGSNPFTSFMVTAEQTGGIPFWESAPDSGYSIDNLPPPTPAPFTATYSSGSTHLHWGVSVALDRVGYRLYRGNSAGFVPGPGNLVIAQPDTGYSDPGPAGSYYKLSAVDIHGNESPYALVTPGVTTDVAGSGRPTEPWLGPAMPNPAPGGEAVIGFALPRESRATLAIYDQQGRRVRALVNQVLPAGEHRARWDGRDEGGRPMPSALYFYRLEVEGRRWMGRVLAIR